MSGLPSGETALTSAERRGSGAARLTRGCRESASPERPKALGHRCRHRYFLARASLMHFLIILCRAYQDVSLYFA
jgi:hypothetical protein